MKHIKRQSKFSVVSGLVVPVQWDANGNAVTVSIHTKDENVFLVEHTKIGNELLNLIQAEVEVTGKIRERIDGKTSIGIKSFKTSDEKSESNIAYR